VSTACISTAALALAALSGTTCEFLEINANPEMLLLYGNDIELTAESATIGVLCKNVFYEGGGDQMWELSRIFLMISLSLGSMATALAWAVSTFLPPTNTNWRLLSFLSSLSAVLQVPIFLLFESKPCSQYKELQSCTLAVGSYFLIGSTMVWVAVTLCTQLLDPPLWAIELSAWRVQKEGQRQRITEHDPEMGYDFHITSIQPSAPQASKQPKIKRTRLGWVFGRPSPQNFDVRAVSTASMQDDEIDQGAKAPSDYDGSLDSRLVLRVLPNGKLPGDEVKSTCSFEDLDPFVRLAEEGKLDGPMQWTPTKSSLRMSSKSGSEPTYLKASSPSQAKDRVTIVGSTGKWQPKSNSPSKGAFRSKTLEAQKECGILVNAVNSKKVVSVPMTGDAILSDLQTERTLPSGQGTSDRDTAPLNGSPSKARADRYTNGIRVLTRKIKSDAQRRKFRRRVRRGYTEMMEDEDSDGSDFMSPPIEVNIQPMQMIEAEKIANEVSDDEKEDLMDDWNALHAATTAGVRLGVNEGSGIDFEEPMDFQPVDSYHSDPEPIYYDSDDDRSEMSLSPVEKTPPRDFNRESDDSSLSSSSASGNLPQEGSSHTRGRCTTRKRRRIRRQPSPIGSLKSGASLMGTTINEETDMDLKEENGEAGLGDAYSLARTKSAPEPRGRDFDRRASRRARPSMSQCDSSPLQVRRQPKEEAEEKKEEPLLGNNRNQNSAFKPILNATILNAIDNENPDLNPVQPDAVSTDEASGYKDGYSLTADEKDPINPPRVPTRSRSPSTERQVKRHLETSSLSPNRDRRSFSVGGMNARAVVGEDDYGSQRSACSNISRRARDFRIRRIQRQKAKVDSSDYVPLSPHRASSNARFEKEVAGFKNDGADDLPSPADTASILRDFTDSDARFEKEMAGFETDGADDLPVDTKSIMRSFTDSGAITPRSKQEDPFSEDMDDRYGSFLMDNLDLQLVEVLRPIGAEYGDEEVSL
jgi:hypothetical protein